jgi:hypothetical protein
MHPMHPAILAALILTRRHTCVCGAYTRDPSGYCVKCRARQSWRRHHRGPATRRRPPRRLVRRTRRFPARMLAFISGNRRMSATAANPPTSPGGDH